MSEPTVLLRVKLEPKHRSTGRTRHLIGTDELPHPYELRIVQYEGHPGYYLFYCDESGKEMTDTFHDSLADAIAQADWEFSVEHEEWQKPI